MVGAHGDRLAISEPVEWLSPAPQPDSEANLSPMLPNTTKSLHTPTNACEKAVGESEDEWRKKPVLCGTAGVALGPSAAVKGSGGTPDRRMPPLPAAFTTASGQYIEVDRTVLQRVADIFNEDDEPPTGMHSLNGWNPAPSLPVTGAAAALAPPGSSMLGGGGPGFGRAGGWDSSQAAPALPLEVMSCPGRFGARERHASNPRNPYKPPRPMRPEPPPMTAPAAPRVRAVAVRISPQ